MLPRTGDSETRIFQYRNSRQINGQVARITHQPTISISGINGRHRREHSAASAPPGGNNRNVRCLRHDVVTWLGKQGGRKEGTSVWLIGVYGESFLRMLLLKLWSEAIVAWSPYLRPVNACLRVWVFARILDLRVWVCSLDKQVKNLTPKVLRSCNDSFSFTLLEVWGYILIENGLCGIAEIHCDL